jgi:hypothetical protein
MYDFKKVGESIYKAEATISNEECKYVYDYMFAHYNNDIGDPNTVPWEQAKQNVLYYMVLKDRRFIDIVNKYKAAMTKEVERLYQEEKIYPHLTTIVLWQPGQSMPRHVDDGVGSETHYEMLKMRKYTTVTYMNNDFEGGETFIRSDGNTIPDFRVDGRYRFPNEFFTDFISIPETGATVMFKGNDTNAHGVNILKSGTRVILSTWFTDDPRFIEPVL